MEEIRLIRWYGAFPIIYKMFYTSPVDSRISSINSMEYKMHICKYTYCAQLKTCCRIGGWNHHSQHSTQRSAIIFWRLASWQGKCTRHGFPLRSTCIRRKLVSNTKSGPKNRVNFRTYVPLPIEGWFWGLQNGPRNAAFFLPFALSFGAQYLVSMAAAATILCVPDRLHHQRVYLLKVSLRPHFYDQHSYYDYKHTHTVYSITISGALF